MTVALKVGGRVSVRVESHQSGYRVGDKGTVLRVSTLVTTGSPS
jgi:hypothetical protein